MAAAAALWGRASARAGRGGGGGSSMPYSAFLCACDDGCETKSM
ncbi:hypothetical protein PtrV1_04750 [Pyrenophora tritici-repentis]|nr:hypothetical protein PtrV1_04750 [Pyrenophora tritici-repentis]